jgi:heme exporter protein B
MSRRTNLEAQDRLPSAFAHFKALFLKEMSIEFRTREMISSMGIYALLVIVVFGVGFGQRLFEFDILPLAGGLLWVSAVFTSLLGLNRSFNREKELMAMEGVLVAPVDRGTIFLAKASANALFLIVVQLVAVPLFIVFFLMSAQLPPDLYLIAVPLLLGSLGIAATGTLLATITMHTRGRDVMLALLFIPVVFPLLYCCTSATSAILMGESDFIGLMQASGMALGYDAIMTLLGWMLYDFVVG